MRLSSKLCLFAGLGSLLVAPAMAAGGGLAPGVPHLGGAPRILRVGPGARVGQNRFPRYGYGDGYLGAAGAGLATAALAEDGYGYGGGGYGGLPPGAVAPPEPPPIAPLPACPMIIKVGPGLDHPVQTRVIYGAPACD